VSPNTGSGRFIYLHLQRTGRSSTSDRQNGMVLDQSWELQVMQSRCLNTTGQIVSVRGKWLRGEIGGTYGQPAEVLVGESVKRIERVSDRAQRKRVLGEAVLYLYGISVEDVPAGAVIRGPIP